MSDPYVGEIRVFGGNFAPIGWQLCDGSLLQIADYETLYNLVGTTYGGDGQSTFGVPDLRGRVPVHAGRGPSGRTYPLSEKAGSETVTLTTPQLPAHTHPLTVSTATGTAGSPDGAYLANNTDVTMFYNDVPTQALPANLVGPAGGSQPHDNLMPVLAVNFIMSLYGVYPFPS